MDFIMDRICPEQFVLDSTLSSHVIFSREVRREIKKWGHFKGLFGVFLKRVEVKVPAEAYIWDSDEHSFTLENANELLTVFLKSDGTVKIQDGDIVTTYDLDGNIISTQEIREIKEER